MSVPPRPTGPASHPPHEAGYEFGDTQKESFGGLATAMSFVGVCTILFAALATVSSAGELYAGFVPGAAGMAILSAICVLAGWWLISAGRALSALVGTRGRDVEHLMAAVVHLRRFFVFVIVILAIAVLGGGGFVAWCTLTGDRGGKCFGL
ncbi:MAG: hypothetical protein WBY94_15550 [Polyangiaceae bacterium]